MSSGEDLSDQEERIRQLLKSIESSPELGFELKLEGLLGGFFEVPETRLKDVGFDMAITAGLSGDWNLALRMTERLATLVDSDRVRLWHLRCLFESSHYAEAISLGRSSYWSNDLRLHANYLTALAYEALSMRSQARAIFDAIAKIDAHFRDVAQRIAE